MSTSAIRRSLPCDWLGPGSANAHVRALRLIPPQSPKTVDLAKGCHENLGLQDRLERLCWNPNNFLTTLLLIQLGKEKSIPVVVGV